MVPDDAVEALAGSLGKKEADPEDGKPVEDKVKVMAAQKLLERSYHWPAQLPKSVSFKKKKFLQHMASWIPLLRCMSCLISETRVSTSV